MTSNDLKWLQMTSLNLFDTQRLICSPFRSFGVIQVKQRKNYLYYKNATVLKITMSFFYPVGDSVCSTIIIHKCGHASPPTISLMPTMYFSESTILHVQRLAEETYWQWRLWGLRHRPHQEYFRNTEYE